MSATSLRRPGSATLRALCLVLLLALLPAAPAALAQDQTPTTVYMPLARNGATPTQPVTPGRAQALELYRTLFLPHTTTAHGWTGNHATCNAGTLAPAFTDALLKLVNYYRAAAGVPAVTFNATYNARAQAAALMMSVNENLSHNPPANWTCYTDDGSLGARRSNLSLFGWYGITDETGLHDAGINGQMEDGGSNNTAVGHRRWILYPYQQELGVGHVPPPGRENDFSYGGGALYVLADNIYSGQLPARQTPRDGFIAWPPPGYIPWQALYHDGEYYYEQAGDEARLRWSFHLQNADFSGATVTMTHAGAAVAVTRLPDINSNYGENTAIWVPALDYATLTDGADHAVQVTVANVIYGGQARAFSYTVNVFDAGA